MTRPLTYRMSWAARRWVGAYWATRSPEFCNTMFSPGRVTRNPSKGGAVSSYEPDHVDPAYFTKHSYSDLS